MAAMELRVFCVEKSFDPCRDEVCIRCVPVQCRSTDSIESVCRAVSEQVHRSVVSLHCMGMLCHSKHSVEYYSVCTPASGGRPVWLARTDIDLSDVNSSIDLDICTLSHEMISLTIADDSKVAGVKEMIHHVAGIPASEQCLLIESCRLEDSKRVKEYGVDKLSDLSLIPRLQAAGFPMMNYVEETDEPRDRVMQVKWGEQPSWRSITSGLNVEGECMNPECDIYRQVAVCKLGHGVFDYILEQAHCPECGHQMAPQSCGFYNCQYRYQGIKDAGFQEIVRSEWCTVNDEFERINPMKERIPGSWERLMIFAKEVESSPQCAVCQSEILKEECYQVGACGEPFHPKCLEAWKACSASGGMALCPTCGTLLQ